MKKNFLQPHQDSLTSFIFIFLSVLVSFMIMALVYPDLLIHHKMVFVHQHDTEIPFYGVFTIVSHFYNGGIQLWDRYDMVRYDFFHITSGIYTLANLLTAGAYIILSPFYKYQGEAFQSIHSIGYHASCIFIRTAGAYLLLRKFVRHPWIIFVSLIYLNTLLSSIQYLGLYTSSYFSLLPLLLYFILCFFENLKLNDFLLAVLTFTVCTSNSAFMALGYFYQAVHFFILSCIAGFFIAHGQESLKNLYQVINKGVTAKNLSKIVLVGVLCFSIMLPFLQMERTITEDFFIPDAFDQNSGGRMTDKFSISKYFSKPTYNLANPFDFFARAVGFGNYVFSDWLFLGFSTLFLSGIALVFSKDKRKHLFLWTIVLIIFLQFPRDPLAVKSIAHWLNALTNPFHFLVRVPHMTSLLLPFFFLPLVAMGLKTMWDLICLKNHVAIYINRLYIGGGLLAATLFLYVFYSTGHGPISEVIIKSLLFGALIGVVYALFFMKSIWVRVLSFLVKYRLKLIVSCVIGFLVIDLVLLSIYIRDDNWSNVRIFPGEINALDDSELIIPIYQNPKIQAFREYYRADANELISRDPRAPIAYKIRNPEYHADGRAQEPGEVSWYRLNSRGSVYGLFYQFNHIGRYLFPASIYHPRPSIFKDLDGDGRAIEYLKHDEQLIYLAKTSITDTGNPDLANPVILNRNAVYIDSSEINPQTKFPAEFNRVTLEGSVNLGKATPDQELAGVDIYFDSIEGRYEKLALFVIDENNNILAETFLEKKEFEKASLLKKFIFSKPLLIKKNQPVNLVLSLTKGSASIFKIKQSKSDKKYIYFEKSIPSPRTQDFRFSMSNGQKRLLGSYTEYSFNLPDTFPAYASSTVFTKDQYKMTLMLGDHNFQPAQGKLVRPYTFDVQNIQTGMLTILLPQNQKLSEGTLTLSYTFPSNILNIWKNEHDNFGFDYSASTDGWLVIHYPFDKKWRLSIDGDPVNIYKANKYFIGAPIEKGEHKILLEYWPESWLRELISLTIFLTLLTFFSLIFIGIKSENSHDPMKESI
jgi:hypothetical protein